MSKLVAEEGEGCALDYGVYGIIRDLIIKEGSAKFVNNSGRYVVNWDRALEYYEAYRRKKDPDFNGPRRRLSNDLRSALLSSSYKKDGAKEYRESRKRSNDDEVVERQFQMPHKVFKSLFGNTESSDSSEAQDEQGIVKAQVPPESSSDAGFDETMIITCGPSEPVNLTSFFTTPSLDDPENFETKVPGTYQQDCGFETQIYNQDSVDLALKGTCSEPEEIPILIEVQCNISPASGSVKGGYPFYILLTEPLPEDVLSGMAEFEGVKKVELKKFNPYTFTGYVPAYHQPDDVGVKVTSQCGKCLGRTFFRYVDEMQEMRKQLVQDPAEQSLLFSYIFQEYGSFHTDSDSAQGLVPPNLQFEGDLDATIQAKQKQSVKILELLVYTAAQTGAKQFIEMIFSTSAQRIVFDCYKDRAQLPEDVARANGHCNLAQYLQDITMRLTKEAGDKPKAIDCLELLKAVQNQVSVSQDKESEEETSSVESDDNSSDYFADTETSSSGSFEKDDVFTSNSEGKDATEKGESKERLPEDRPYSSTPDANHLVDSKPPNNEKQNGSSFLGVIHDDVHESFLSGVCVDGAVSRDRYKKKITDVHFPASCTLWGITKEENNKHHVMAGNAAVKANKNTASICHLRKENHRQDLVPKKVYRTCQDPEMLPSPPTLWPCRAGETSSERTKCSSVSRIKEKKRLSLLITEDTVISASTRRFKRPAFSRLAKVHERHLNQEQVIFEKSIGDESVHSPSTLLPSCSVLSLFPGNVSLRSQSNMKEFKMEFFSVCGVVVALFVYEVFPEATSQDKESKEERTPAESDDNSSDYFANAETSSCGSFEHDDDFTSDPEGKDAAEKGEIKERLLKDPPYSSIPDVNHPKESDFLSALSLLRVDSPTGESKERLLKDPPYSSIPDVNHLEDSKPLDEKQSDSSFLGSLLRGAFIHFGVVIIRVGVPGLICLSVAEMKAIARKFCGRCCSIVEMKEIARRIFGTMHIAIGDFARFPGKRL